ncbi:hypothetical protein RCL1_005225 [Eukaryota sp. TZLM3-RCL]
MDYSVRLSLAKTNNPAFANFLIDVKDSSATALFTQIPQVYGFLLNDHQWTTAMRLRCFLWPNNLPHELVCKCSQRLTFHHLFNCKYFITYRSVLHDGVRDQLRAMCKSHKVESFVEPLLRKLAENEDDDSSGEAVKHFDLSFWTNRLVFTIFKMVPLVISRSLEAVSVILESKAGVRLDESDVCFDDIDF